MSVTTSPKTTEKAQRAPVVAIMGHIDHGKSTLLDYIRSSRIVAKEAGGITQHLGAYEVEHGNSTITFIDTPGHAAFTHVRTRSAVAADIAILIVSAEDGVMPQTKEALSCIREAKLPFIVAINKVDSPKANITQTQSSLIENEIYVEGLGGDIPVVQISALKGTGVSDLLDMITLVADMEGFTGDADQLASGVVVEANMDKQRGITATMIVKNGTVKQGQFVACGNAYAPVRILENSLGKVIKEATFSSPIKIFGWNSVPVAGEEFITFKSKKEAEEYAATFKEVAGVTQSNALAPTGDELAVLPIVIKADTTGSIEAVQQELAKLHNERIAFRVISTGTGAVSEADVKTASGNPGTVIVGFNISIDKQALSAMDRLEVETRTFKIIYEAIDWLSEVALKNTPEVTVEMPTGSIKILKAFSLSKGVQVMGGKVTEGMIKKGQIVKISRRGEELGTAKVQGLQQARSEANEVSEGNEFGMSLSNRSTEIMEGDVIIPFESKQT